MLIKYLFNESVIHSATTPSPPNSLKSSWSQSSGLCLSFQPVFLGLSMCAIIGLVHLKTTMNPRRNQAPCSFKFSCFSFLWPTVMLLRLFTNPKSSSTRGSSFSDSRKSSSVKASHADLAPVPNAPMAICIPLPVLTTVLPNRVSPKDWVPWGKTKLSSVCLKHSRC